MDLVEEALVPDEVVCFLTGWIGAIARDWNEFVATIGIGDERDWLEVASWVEENGVLDGDFRNELVFVEVTKAFDRIKCAKLSRNTYWLKISGGIELVVGFVKSGSIEFEGESKCWILIRDLHDAGLFRRGTMEVAF